MKKMRDVLYRIWIDPRQYRFDQPVRMVLLADLHSNQIGRDNEVLIREIRKFQPDLILVAGDCIVGEKNSDTSAAENLMKKLGRQYPVYYENGNHEHRMKEKPEIYGDGYQRYRQRLKASGIHLLENKRERIAVKGLPLTIYGLELEQKYFRRSAGRRRLSAEEVRQYVGGRKKDGFAILLAHNPVFFPAYAQWGADLVCAGHLHGGIVRIPGLGGVISPQMRLFPKYDRGRYQEGKSTMIVSAGLGSHTIPFRLFNPIELVKIELTNQADKPPIQETAVRWKQSKR